SERSRCRRTRRPAVRTCRCRSRLPRCLRARPRSFEDIAGVSQFRDDGTLTEPLPTLPAVAPPERPPALAPVAAAFVVFGVFWGGWAVAVADIEHELHFSHARFGLLLSAALAAAGVANALGGALAERHGTGRLLAVSLAVWVLLLASGAVAHNRAAL